MTKQQFLDIRNNRKNVKILNPSQKWQRIGRLSHRNADDTINIIWHNGLAFQQFASTNHNASEIVVLD